MTVENAVVTFVQSDKKVFIQDPAASEYGGVVVYFNGGGLSPAVGDVVTVQGEVDEYYDLTEIVLQSAADLTVTGNASATAVSLNAAASDWEIYDICMLSLLVSQSLLDRIKMVTLRLILGC